MKNLQIEKDRIYSWYVDSDFLFLKFMCHKGFLEKIYIRNLYYVRKKIIILNML